MPWFVFRNGVKDQRLIIAALLMWGTKDSEKLAKRLMADWGFTVADRQAVGRQPVPRRLANALRKQGVPK